MYYYAIGFTLIFGSINKKSAILDVALEKWSAAEDLSEMFVETLALQVFVLPQTRVGKIIDYPITWTVNSYYYYVFCYFHNLIMIILSHIFKCALINCFWYTWLHLHDHCHAYKKKVNTICFTGTLIWDCVLT